MIQMHIYGILAILEVFLAVSGVAGYLYLRNRKYNRTISDLQSSLNQRSAAPQIVEVEKPASAPAAVETQSYSDFLREELDSSSIMLGSDTTPGNAEEAEDEGDLMRHMLAARHQFLQLELDAQAMGKDPEARRKHIVEQMQGLLNTLNSLRSEPEPEPAAGDDNEAAPDEAMLAREKQLESQLTHLRTVIGNQQDVMRELRELLEKEMGDSEEMRAIIGKLQDAEASSLDLERSLEVMEKDAADFAAQGGGYSSSYDSAPDSDMLRDLVGSQQQTINNLQNMLKQTVEDSGASVELRNAIEKIQRSNQELGTCVMVLEDENTMLRDQIESLHSQLESFMGGGDPDQDEEAPTSDEIRSEIESLPEEPLPDASASVATPPESPGADEAPGVIEEAVEDLPEVAESLADEPESQAQATAAPEPAAGEAPEAAVEEDEIDALIAGAASSETTQTGQPEAIDEQAQTDSPTEQQPVDDVDAQLAEAAEQSEAAAGETPTGAAAEPPAAEADPAAEESVSGDDVDALLEQAQDDTDSADGDGKTEADGGINTLRDIDIAEDDSEELSDDDIDALLSGEKKA